MQRLENEDLCMAVFRRLSRIVLILEILEENMQYFNLL